MYDPGAYNEGNVITYYGSPVEWGRVADEEHEARVFRVEASLGQEV